VYIFVYLQLATEMLRLFDPTMEPQSAPPEEALNLIPIYRNPKIQGGLLPGKMFLSTNTAHQTRLRVCTVIVIDRVFLDKTFL